jgi:hypothetical protein
MFPNQVSRLFRGLPLLAAIITFVSSVHAEVRITEIMAAGQSAIADEDGGYPDWIELHNPDASAADLTGWHLTDDIGKASKWTFPARSLEPGGYLVVFASAKDRKTDPLHTNFRLTSGGEYVALTRPDGSIAQEIAYPVQIPDLSFDGTSFLVGPTPGAANAAPLAMAKAPLFSAVRGFYSDPFQLTLSSGTEGAQIRYTLDGSEPDASRGTLYSAPLRIAATTVVRAVAFADGAQASPSVTASYLFPVDVVKQSPSGSAPPGWPKKWGTARVDYGMDPRITKKAPYKNTIKNDLLEAPSISIVMELPDLFDPAEGIYTNSFEKGIDWEKPMSIELIDPAGGKGFQTNAGLRIRGGASRDPGNPKHSFQVRMRSVYGAPVLKYPLFGPAGAQAISRFDLRWDHLVSWHYSSEVNATQLPDIFGRDTQLATGSPAKRGNVFHLYINGQYWGVYFSDERVDSDWAASYFGGGDDDYDVVKYDSDANFGTGYADGTPYSWRKLYDAGVRGFRDNADYFRVQGQNPDGSRNREYERQLDVDNLIDYMITGIYCAATDNPPSGGTQNNWYSFKSRKGDFGFRFFVHDFELSMLDVNDDVILREPPEDPFGSTGAEGVNPWHYWEALRQNPEFRLRVADHLQKLFFNGGALTPEVAAARWQARMDELDRAMVPESARWGQPAQGGIIWNEAEAKGRPISPKPGGGGSKKQFTHEDWQRAANAKLTDYFPERSAIVLQQFKEANLYPAVDAPVFSSGPDGLTISNPNPTGQIFYTLDGSDPRAVGGGLSDSALAYTGPIPSALPTQVRARAVVIGAFVVNLGGPIVLPPPEWSAIVETTTQPAQDFSGLRITELHYNPPPGPGTSSDDGEFLELKNEGNGALNLSGLVFTAGIDFVFPPNTTLAAGGFFVLARNATVFAQLHPGVAIGGIYTGRLADEGETLTLSTPAGATVLTIRYDDSVPWPLAADGLGFSLVPAGAGDPSEPENWRTSTAPGGSPGADDPAGAAFPRVVIHEVLANETSLNPLAAEEFIELANLGDAPADVSGWFLTNDFDTPTRFRIPDGTIIQPHQYVVFSAADFAASALTLPSEGGGVWLFSGNGTQITGTVHGLEYGAQEEGVSFSRYVADDDREYFPATAVSRGGQNGPPITSLVRITEIHYATIEESGSRIAPTFVDNEFIEIENLSDAPLNLSGARLNGLNFTFPDGASAPAHSRFLVVNVPPTAFRASHGVPAEVQIFGPATGTLQDDGEFVSLEASVVVDGQPGLKVVEMVRYNDRQPWPTLAAGFGYSLQRVPGGSHAFEPGSWVAGPPSPGLGNTINLPPTIVLTSPLPLTDVISPAIVHFAATATDPDGSVAKVEFLVDDEVVGESTGAPYEFDWQPTPGIHDLTARATDALGSVTESAFVTINVDSPNEGTGLGLRGEYFPNTNFDGTPVVRNDPVIQFDWFETPPIDGVPRQGFSVRWSGSVLPRRSGEHVFNLGITGRARLVVDGQTVVEVTEEPKEGQIFFVQGIIDLTAGVPADLILEYIDDDGAAYVEMRWTEPGDFSDLPVPQTQLFLPGQDPAALGIASSGVLPRRQVGREFRTQLQAANGRRPYAWSISGGALPQGVALSAAGQFSGAAAKAGVFEFVVRVEDADGSSAEKPFTVQVIDTSHPELKPVVAITEPAPGTSFEQNQIVRVRGTASAKQTLATIEYSLNSGPWHALAGTAAWSFALTPAKGLQAGTNIVRVRATDVEGRRSAMQTRSFKRVVRAPLVVTIEGAGTVTSGFLGTTQRFVGQDYIIEATPAPGWVFSEWQGAFAFGKRLQFTMSEGLEIKAVFIPNPYPALAGPYTGLLVKRSFDPGPLRGLPGGGEDVPLHLTRGVIDVRLNAAGSFTMSLRFAGNSYSARGRFNAFGSFFKQFRDPETGASLFLNLSLALDTGTIFANVNNSVGDFFSESEGALSRSSFTAENPCPVAQAYTTRLSPGDAALPAGSGFATLSVTENGRARWVGELADGTPWSASGRVTDHLAVPLYSSLYTGGGSLSGLFSFAKTLGVRAFSELLWTRPELAVPGFEGTTQMLASPYTPPAAGTPVLNLPVGRLILDGGELAAPIGKTISLGNDNVFLINDGAGEEITLSIDPATGLMDGSFLHPTGGSTKLRGIVDQLDNSAAGYFLGPQTGGSLVVTILVTIGTKKPSGE